MYPEKVTTHSAKDWSKNANRQILSSKTPGIPLMQILEHSKSWEYNSLCSNSSSSCLIVPINQNLSSGRIGKAASQSLFEVLSKATIGINVILIPPIGSIMIHFIIFFLVQIMILSFLGALHLGPLDPQTRHFDLRHSHHLSLSLLPHSSCFWLTVSIFQLSWGLTCGPPGSRAQYQNLMLHGFSDNNCKVFTWMLMMLMMVMMLHGFSDNICKVSTFSNPCYQHYPLVLPHHLKSKNNIWETPLLSIWSPEKQVSKNTNATNKIMVTALHGSFEGSTSKMFLTSEVSLNTLCFLSKSCT